MGERFPPPQAGFTNAVRRFVGERVEIDAEGRRKPPRLIYKVVGLEQEQGGRKSVRCWIPDGTGPREPGVSEGRWVGEAVRDFQSTVDSFCRVRDVADVDA